MLQKKSSSSVNNNTFFESKNLTKLNDDEQISDQRILQRTDTNRFSLKTKKHNTFFQNFAKSVGMHHKLYDASDAQRDNMFKLNAYTKKTATAVGKVLGYCCSSSNYPIHELLDSIPKSCEFIDKPGCYLLIKCKGKNFPAFIATDQQGVMFNFCINVINTTQIDKKNKSHPVNHVLTALSKKHESSPTKKHKASHQYIVKTSTERFDIKRHERPTFTQRDVELSGDYLVLDLPKEKKEKAEYLYIYVVSPIKTRVSIAISFTSERYFRMQKTIGFKAFSQSHILE